MAARLPPLSEKQASAAALLQLGHGYSLQPLLQLGYSRSLSAVASTASTATAYSSAIAVCSLGRGRRP